MDYLPDIPFTVFLELTAAIVAVGSLIKFPQHFGRPERVLVFYLCISFFSECIGLTRGFIYNNGLEDNAFYLKYPQLTQTYWWFNIYIIIAALCFGFYFRSQLKSSKFKKIFKWVLIVFLVTTVINLIFSDVYFANYSLYTDVTSVIILGAIISFYYYELLSSDAILSLGRSFPFLISIPVFLYYIAISPLFFLSSFLVPKELVFYEFYRSLLASGNFLLYGMFIFGYLWCYWFNKSLNRKSSSLSTS